ncbi:unnamed protein product, partial [Mesocestoides corti]|uniref:G_PROTEIN_RECEP_F1_2 domain-containing protein n=1 Tax=Mesocestoides corti TaxID=53468 RepID=A0A0R3UDD5_MESCO
MESRDPHSSPRNNQSQALLKNVPRMNHSASDHDFVSKTFWYCIPFTNWPDAIDIFNFIFEISGMILNMLITILLFRLQHGPKTSLTLLRTLAIHSLLSCIINFANDVNPKSISTKSVIFNQIVCVLWHSRFFYWIFTVAAIECLVFFSIDRAILMQKPDLYQFTSEKRRITFFEVTTHVFSVLITAPQILTVNIQSGRCY